MAYSTVHNAELPITKMVLNRIPFLDPAEDSSNVSIISDFIQEVSWELEPCFKIRLLDDGTEDKTRVADEQYYDVRQKSLVADVVALYILLQFATKVVPISSTTGSSSTGGSTGDTFIKKAVAGSVQVEYGLVEGESTSSYEKLKMTATDLFNEYKEKVYRKSKALGCYLAICDDDDSTDDVGSHLFRVVTSKCR